MAEAEISDWKGLIESQTGQDHESQRDQRGEHRVPA